MPAQTKLPENMPTAAEFAQGGYHQVPPGDREEWAHEFYDQRCGFVRFKHKETGETVVCPNMWYNGTPQSAIDRRRFWIEQGEERKKYWQSRPDDWESRYHIGNIDRSRAEHEEAIAFTEATGKVI